MTKKENTSKLLREISLDIIMEITVEGNFSHQVLRRKLNGFTHLEKQERAFITRLCEGTIERLITLDYIINQSSKVKVNKMKPFIRNLLRLSVYQIYYMDNIPESAICNEAVKIAKKRGFTNLSGFVNGVLRGILRGKVEFKLPNDLSVLYSVPQWLVDELTKQYGKDTVKKILQASFEENETSIRFDENKVSKEELIQLLESEHVTVKEGNYLPYALKISNYDRLLQLKSFNDGLYQVQDESSMLVGQVAGVKENHRIIDVCAAPGGKSLHVATLLNGTGSVSSRDVSEYKVNLIDENIKRLGLTNIVTKIADASLLYEEDINSADIVIADVPCSGLGVIGKKSDIKYNMSMEKLEGLQEIQRNILDKVQNYVKAEGTLIYSTCTINIRENIENVRWFLEKYNYRLDSLDNFITKELQSETTKEGYLQLVPGIHKTDGFFIARLIKNS